MGFGMSAMNAGPDSEQKLERRREQLRRSRDRVSAAQTAVRETEARLHALDDTDQDVQRRLKLVEQEVAALKKQLKRNAKEREQLQAERKQAVRRTGALTEAVREAETKYDKAVLADLVRREKERDLARHTGDDPAPAGEAPGFTVVDRRETPRSDQVAHPDPAVVPADPAPAKVSGRTATRRPRPANGSAANGSAANGSAANGSAANGSAANGNTGPRPSRGRPAQP
jgi:hypothetical protein